jgi:hypothetical protein
MDRPVVTVRQTIDPFDDIQYTASREVTLEHDGTLRMSTIGLGKPGDNFAVCHILNLARTFQLNNRNYRWYLVKNGQVISIG